MSYCPNCVYSIKAINFRVAQEDPDFVTCHVEVRPAGCPHSYSAGGNAGGAVGVGEFLHLSI